MNNITGNRGNLCAVTCPHVDGLPEHLTAGKRYEVCHVDGCGYITIEPNDGLTFNTTLRNCGWINGADWIPHYEGDVIQGFGEYRTRSGEKAQITAHRGERFWCWLGKINDAEYTWSRDGVCHQGGEHHDPLDIISPWEEACEADDENWYGDWEETTQGELRQISENYIAKTGAVDGSFTPELTLRLEPNGRAMCVEGFGITNLTTLAMLVKYSVSVIETPETLTKKEARVKFFLADEDVVLHPVGWPEGHNIKWAHMMLRVLKVVEGAYSDCNFGDFPEDQLFIKVPS